MAVDRRVKYTKTVLKNALLELMQTYPIDKITVTALCEKADVNRGTFYAHYKDAYDLLQQIESELIDEVIESIPPTLKIEELSQMLELIFTTIKRNGSLCRVLFAEHNDKRFLKQILEAVRPNAFLQWRKLNPSAPEEQLDLLYTFFSNGAIAIISNWVQQDMEWDAASLARFIEQVSLHGLDAVRR
ncbi:MAG: TetR-like C-terminal domain-containing protein [Clostridia bacterium]|nr:TetR-like C-terminal domain-containing protein [Clostridia bacterium]